MAATHSLVSRMLGSSHSTLQCQIRTSEWVLCRGVYLQVGDNKTSQVNHSVDPPSSESLSDERHELLLALVYLLQVVYKLGELNVSIGRHQEGLPGFAEELDEFAVVAWADVRQPRVCGVDVGADGGVQQLPEWSLVKRHQLGRVSATVERDQARRR